MGAVLRCRPLGMTPSSVGKCRKREWASMPGSPYGRSRWRSRAGVLSFGAGLWKVKPMAESEMVLKITAALFVLLSVSRPLNSAAQNAPATQLHFSAEDSAVEKPIPLPEDVR